MNKLTLSFAGFAAMMALGAPPAPTSFHAELEGENEVPLVASAGTAEWTGTLNAAGNDIAWTITFSGLSGPPTQSHIHFGQSFVSGGVVYWICGNGNATPPTPGPLGTAACPTANNGTLSGHITMAAIQAVTAQGISAGDFAKILAALRAGEAYVNIHSAQSPGGEIRGQVQVTKGHGNGNGNGKIKDKDGDD